jgi:hypothetical protein
MKRLKYIAFLLTGVFLVSCQQSLEELNIDPSNPASATVELVFPAGVMSAGSVAGGRYAIVGGIWSQYYTQNHASNQYKDIEAFYYEPADFATQWQELYSGALNDLKYVKKESSKNKNWSFYLMATVIEAYTFQLLTDIHGDVPFNEALRADEGLINPHYEGSQNIYDSLIKRIDNALAKDFSAATVTDPGESDFIFGGPDTELGDDIDKWIQFANTLKLKIYLRQSEKRPAVAQAGVQALYAAGAEFLSEDAAIKRFEDAASKSNPLYEQDQRQLNTATNLRASKTLFSFLESNQDSLRIKRLYIPGNAGQKPMDQGAFNQTTTALNPLSVSRARLSAVDPVYFISKAESYFLQAEAVERGWAPGNAKTLYDAGVTASFDMFDDPAASPADLNAAPYLAPGGKYEFGVFYGGDRLGAIIVQKWASMAGTRQGIEAFFERMRTGYPKTSAVYHTSGTYKAGEIVYPKEGTTNGKFATRLFYPDTEISRNPNAPPQSSITDPLWWHK